MWRDQRAYDATRLHLPRARAAYREITKTATESAD
jgi:hypothetical protein